MTVADKKRKRIKLLKEETLEVPEEEIEIEEVERPRFSLEHILIFVLLFGFVISLVGFWNMELHLWNRFVYSTGSQWENASPIFLETDLATMKNQLSSYFIALLIGTLAFFVVSLIVFKKYFNPQDWKQNEKLVTIALMLISGAVSVMGFWLYNSIDIIRNVNEEANQWITQDIPNLSQIFQMYGGVISIYFAMALIVGSIIFYQKSTGQPLIVSLRALFASIKHVIRHPSSIISRLVSPVIHVVKNSPFYLILVFYLIITLLPVFLTLTVSLTTFVGLREDNLFNEPLRALMLNYSSVMFALSRDEPAFASAFINSVTIGIGTGVLGLAVSVSAAYALARFDFRGNNILTFLILSTQMFPGLILLIPQFVIWKNLGLLQDQVVLFGVLLAYSAGATAYCTWMMKGYFESIPVDIEEAAIIDGAGRFGTFIKIALPLAKPGMIAVMVFTFLTAWQEFVLARTFIGETDPRATLPLLFYNYQNTAAPDNPIFYELLAPYAILVALPVVIFFLLLQKDLAAGAVAGGIK